MRTVLFSVFVVVVFAAVSCMPPPNATPLQPDGGVLGKVVTESDTQSTIKAWGQGASNVIAFEQAKNAGAEAMAKDAALDIRKAMMDSGWKQIVERTCALNMNTGAVRKLTGGVRWEGEVVCQRQQLLDWLKDGGYAVVNKTKKIALPKVCLVPDRLFGMIDNLELNDDEKYVKNAALETLRERNSGFQIDDYETLLRSWSSMRAKVSGDLDINPQFAVEADMYIKFSINCEPSGRFIKATGTFEAIFVSTGKTAGNAIGNSKEYNNTSGMRANAIADCAKNGIDQIYEDMMKNWKEEFENGFYYRIYFIGVEGDDRMKIRNALMKLKSPDGIKPQQNSYDGNVGKLDMSVYVNEDCGDVMTMSYELGEALKEQGLKIDTTILELRHALGYKIAKMD